MTNSQRITASICKVTDTIKRITRFLTYCRNSHEKQCVDDMLLAALDTAFKLPDMMVALHKLVYLERCNYDYAMWCAKIDKYLSTTIYGTTKNGSSWLKLFRDNTFHSDMIDDVDKIDEKFKIKDDYLLIAFEKISGDEKTTLLLRMRMFVIFLLVQQSFQELTCFKWRKMEKQCSRCSKIFEENYRDKVRCSEQDKNADGSFKCARYEYRDLDYNTSQRPCCLDHICFNCKAPAAKQSRRIPQALLAKYIVKNEESGCSSNHGYYRCIDNKGIAIKDDIAIIKLIDVAWAEFNAFFEDVQNGQT